MAANSNYHSELERLKQAYDAQYNAKYISIMVAWGEYINSNPDPQDYKYESQKLNEALEQIRIEFIKKFQSEKLELNQRYAAAATAASMAAPQHVAARPTPNFFTFSNRNIARSGKKNHSHVNPIRNVHRTNVTHPNARGGKRRTKRRTQKRR